MVRGWEHERRNGVDLWRWCFDEGEWVAACAGAGVGAATRAFAEIEKDGAVSLAISTGWAGALNGDYQVGQAYLVGGVVDLRTGERFTVSERSFTQGLKPEDLSGGVNGGAKAPPLQNNPWLVTSPIVANHEEKQRLADAYGAGLVDMEAAGVARLALMRGIPFYCLKAVSDGFREKLPDFNRFIRVDGRFDMAGMVLYSIMRPQFWPSLMRMGENSRKASQAIRESLLDFLDERGFIRERNVYPGL